MIRHRSYNATACGDGFFGPAVWADGCRGGFDFTLSFEESILSTLPSALFLLFSIPRAIYLLRTPDKAKRRSAYTPKLIASSAYAGLQVGSLALVASSRRLNTRFSLAAAILNLVAACCIVLLSHIEHVKSIRPSFLLTSYLFTSLLFDAARLRTEWLLSVNVAYAAVLFTSTILKLALLVLENVEKRRILLDSGKERSTESTSGPFNRGFFVWLNSLLISGWATVLTLHDLPAIYEKLSSEKLAVIFTKRWDKVTRDGRKASLFLNSVWILKLEILGIVFPRLATIALTLAQPFLVSQALRFLAMPKDEHSDNIGYGLIGAFAFVFVGSAILTAWYEHLTFRVNAMIRGGLIGLIYRKILRLSASELNESAALTLMGNDIETLAERANALLIEAWANSLTVGIAIWMLYAQLGLVFVAPIAMAIISIALCWFIGKVLVKRQTVYQKATQDRINFTSEVLGSIKAVKMLGYTERFTELLEQKRDNDLQVGKRFRWMTVWANTVGNANISLTQAATFGAYAIVAKLSDSQSFSASQAITALSILNVMSNPLSNLLFNISSAYSALGCFKRIQDFLLLNERADHREICARPGLSSTWSEGEESQRSSIELRHLDSFKDEGARIHIAGGEFAWKDKKVLSNINASFSQAPSGSLTIIVGPIGSGKSSLLKAILGETRSTGGKVSLSTPSVAFCDQTPWVMNATIRDNIVAESGHFEDKWFDTVIEACDLAQDLSRLPDGVSTMVGDKGVKLSGGQKQRLAIARAVYARKPVAIFDDVFSALDKATERIVFARVFSKDGLLRRSGTTVILATHSVHLLPGADHIIALGTDGQVIEQGSFANLQETGKYIQSLDITDPHSESDDEEATPKQDTTKEPKNPSQRQHDGEEQDQEQGQQQGVSSDRSTFKYYFSAMQPLSLAIGGAYVGGQAFCSSFRSVWLTWWGDGRGRSSNDVGYWLSIFTVLAAIEATLISLAIIHFLLIIGPTVSKKFHSRILNAVMRFSQDLRLVDIDLPVALAIFLFDISICIGVTGLAVGAVGYFAASLPFVITILLMIQRFYVRTSKQLRILEIEHKAPLYSHFLESMHGLATIRAFGWTHPYSRKNLALLDSAQKPSYLLNCIQRWLTLVLDLVVAVLTVLLVVFAVVLRGKLNPSLLGVALVNMMNLGLNLKGIILAWSQLETSLGAVTRIKTFEETTPSELLPKENYVPPAEWPSRGSIDFVNLSVQYDSNSHPVLTNITLSIAPSQKLGLVGRSGSGKSSLIQALFRMANTPSGAILLDGIDISTIPKPLVRQRLSCLTQDPFFFTNTIRFNADPLGAHSDADIVGALQRAAIWDVIRAKVDDEGVNPLDERIDETFFSHGQRQLFCLGRALLKKSSILILDEPTSNIDNQTDAQIQRVIKSEFKDRTVIMIAHRLDSLLEFDTIAVLEEGSLVEVGAPGELLMRGGAFSRLYASDKTNKRRSLDDIS
ncbi:P-loop containing nucleoside triphosphate hydrolase protein [Trichoderma citrinoviride]|uniref:P-loop containing nucleoside triphosphate hydrolase protein n=1 Tax=Trichoderma citrinoviride TaxID=58853 RepID=A0A2T4BJW7_9HYPO|nr:P-loop containing nucleoside triphosphate hydrolase protein [Trichoderma citrinoviride]PTB69610.1 P-loop containing nucleoside triphosphate hydrolase protein [Trichoderma citrinoviride]